MLCKYFITHIILVAAEGLWHTGSLFYHNTLYSQWGWYITNLLLCDIPRNKAPRTGPRHIWCTYKLCPFCGREKNIDGRAVWLISLTIVYGYLLLLLAAVVPLLLLPQNSLLTSLAFAPDSESVSATRIFLMASSSSFIYLFFRPLLDTHNHLPCVDYYVWLGMVSETLYQ